MPDSSDVSASPTYSLPIRVFVCSNSDVAAAGVRQTLKGFVDFKIISCVREVNAQQILELKPDILLLVDMGLPAIDWQATRLIKEQAPQIGIAVLSSRSDHDYALSALDAGADSFCLANVPPDQFYLALKSTSYRASWLDPSIARGLLCCHGCAHKRSRSGSIELSSREQEVLNLLVEGMSNKEIAARLVLSIETVKSHIRHLMEKLRAKHRTQVVVEAINNGLVG